MEETVADLGMVSALGLSAAFCLCSPVMAQCRFLTAAEIPFALCPTSGVGTSFGLSVGGQAALMALRSQHDEEPVHVLGMTFARGEIYGPFIVVLPFNMKIRRHYLQHGPGRMQREVVTGEFCAHQPITVEIAQEILMPSCGDQVAIMQIEGR
jgi:tellurite resistance protein TehA-like permease